MDTTEQEQTRLRQITALKEAAGVWKDKNHPELKEDAVNWVRRLRQENERRFQRQISR